MAKPLTVTYADNRMTDYRFYKKRPVVLPALGNALEKARGTQDKGVVIAKVQAFSSETLGKFDQSRLEHYEAGTVLGPDPLVLLALADILGKQIEGWLWLLKWNREHLGDDQAPENIAVIKDGAMRVVGNDRDILRRLHELTPDGLERVLYQLDMELTQERGGVRGRTRSFRRSRRENGTEG
jgi:hypothetical protein